MTRKIGLFIFPLLLLLLLLSSCTPQPEIRSPEPVSTKPVEPIPSITLTASATQRLNLMWDCLEIREGAPDGNSVGGVLVLRHLDEMLAILWNLETEEKITIEAKEENQKLWYFRVSPNRNKLLYRATIFDRPITAEPQKYVIEDQLVVVDNRGEMLIAINWDDALFSIDWFDNENLVITKPGALLLYNIATGEHTEPVQEFPELFFASIVLLSPELWMRDVLAHQYELVFGGDGPVGWENILHNGGVVLDTSLNLAIYPGTYLDDYVVLNIETGEIIQRLPFILSSRNEPMWSPNEQQLLVVGNQRANEPDIFLEEEFYLVNRADWQFEKISHFRDYYGKDLILELNSWSPDGDRIAFGLDTIRDDTPAEYGVYDVETGVVTFHCIESDYFSRHDSSIIWSPTSHQFLVNSNTSISEGDQPTKTILVDLIGNASYEIVEDMFPVGWMNSD